MILAGLKPLPTLFLVLWKPGLYIMLDKCSTMESLPFIRLYLLRDHMDLLGFLDGDHIFLHPQGLCFTCSGCLCQIPILQIILISLTSCSETPRRLLPLLLRPLLATALSLGCVLECPGGTPEHVPTDRNLCAFTVILVRPSQPLIHQHTWTQRCHSLPVLLFLTSRVLCQSLKWILCFPWIP